MILTRTAPTSILASKGRGTRLVVVCAKPKLDAGGFVKNDNSGKANIFPTSQKAFYSSPRTNAVASQGLGGAQGGVVLAGALALVGLATAAVLFQGSGETLNQVQGAGAESLSAIAGRIAQSI